MNTEAKTATYIPKPPGNYLQEFNDQFKNVLQKHPEVALEGVLELAAYGLAATQGSCWVLNESARDFIMHTVLPDDALQDWRLPYPRMTIEWLGTWDSKVTKEEGRENEHTYVPALERIIMLAESKAVTKCSEKTHTFECIHEFDGFYITSFFKQPYLVTNKNANSWKVATVVDRNVRAPLPWTINPIALLIPYSCFNHLDKWFSKIDGKLKMLAQYDRELALDRPTAMCAVKSFDYDWSKMLEEGMVAEGVRDLIEEVHIALGLLAMLRCENVPTQIVKASQLKQARRKKQKKTRIPDYRVLHLSDHTLRGYKGGEGKSGEKAPHWRRGHIRNQPTAMGIVRKWIAPQIIRADKLTDNDLPPPKTAVT